MKVLRNPPLVLRIYRHSVTKMPGGVLKATDKEGVTLRYEVSGLDLSEYVRDTNFGTGLIPMERFSECPPGFLDRYMIQITKPQREPIRKSTQKEENNSERSGDVSWTADSGYGK